MNHQKFTPTWSWSLLEQNKDWESVILVYVYILLVFIRSVTVHKHDGSVRTSVFVAVLYGFNH